MKENQCFSCKQLLLKVPVGDHPSLKLKTALTCVNDDCPSRGLLAVGGFRYIKKKGEK